MHDANSSYTNCAGAPLVAASSNFRAVHLTRSPPNGLFGATLVATIVLLAHPTVPHSKSFLLAFARAPLAAASFPRLRYVRCRILPEPPSWRIPRSYNIYYYNRTSSSDPSSSSLYRAAMILFRWLHRHRRHRRWPYFPAVADSAFPCRSARTSMSSTDDDR